MSNNIDVKEMIKNPHPPRRFIVKFQSVTATVGGMGNAYINVDCEGTSMKWVRGIFQIAILMASLCLALSCNEGSSETSAEGAATETDATIVDLTSGMGDISTDAIIRYDFGNHVDPPTVNESSFFIIPYFDIDSAAMTIKSQNTYDYDICAWGEAPDAVRICNGTACTIRPSNDFIEGVQYYLCITPAIHFLDGTVATATSIPFTIAGDTSSYCSALFSGSCSWDGISPIADDDAISYDDFTIAISDFVSTPATIANCLCTYVAMNSADTSSGCISYDEVRLYDFTCANVDLDILDYDSDSDSDSDLAYITIVHADLALDETYAELINTEWDLDISMLDDSICDVDFLRFTVSSDDLVGCAGHEYDSECMLFSAGVNAIGQGKDAEQGEYDNQYYVYMTGSTMLSMLQSASAVSGQTVNTYYIDHYVDYGEEAAPIYDADRGYDIVFTFEAGDLTMCD